MAGPNILVYYDTATITTAKSFLVMAPRLQLTCFLISDKLLSDLMVNLSRPL